MSDFILVYVTCASEQEAELIARDLVEKSLVACANIMPPHKSVYRWNDKIGTNDETSMILKSRAALFEKIRERVAVLHSYECPCIVSVPVCAGHEPFLRWVDVQTGAGKQ